MAHFIVGCVGYGWAIVCAGFSAGAFNAFMETSSGKEEIQAIAISGAFSGAAILIARLTYEFLGSF